MSGYDYEINGRKSRSYRVFAKASYYDTVASCTNITDAERITALLNEYGLRNGKAIAKPEEARQSGDTPASQFPREQPQASARVDAQRPTNRKRAGVH